MKGLKRKFNNWLTNKCVSFIRSQAEDSTYIKYAKSEMNWAWPGVFTPTNEDQDMQKLMCDQVLDLLSVLHTQGDSGATIGYKLNLLNRLIRFKPISSLTFADSEFNERCYDSEGIQIRQNKRLSSVFAETNPVDKTTEYHYLDGICKKDYGYVVVNKDKSYGMKYTDNPMGYCTGGAFVISNNGQIRWSNLRAIIKDPKTFDPDKTFAIPNYQIEYPNGWWLSFVKASDIKEASKYYNIKLKDKEGTARQLYKEIKEFKNGKYEEELKNRIQFLTSEISQNKDTNKNLLEYVRTKRKGNSTRSN